MPVMTKMRDSMPVVFAVLAGIFLLMIIFQWGGQGTIFAPKGENGVLGTVNGFPITQQVYNSDLEEATAEMKSKDKDKDKEEALNESDEADAADNAWDKAVSDAIKQQSIDKMGIIVTPDEIRDMLFNNPPADIKKALTDSLGNFNQQLYFKELRDPRMDSTVRILEGKAKQQIEEMKWQQALASTILVTDTEAFLRFMTDSAKAIVQVVKIMAPQVSPDMTAHVPEKQIQQYYDTHSWLYPQEEQRKFKFVRFPFVPNAHDTAMVMETANTLKARLAEVPVSTTDTANIDTVVKELTQDYSDAPFKPRHIITMRELGSDTALLSAKEGDNVVAKIEGKITALRVLKVLDTGKHMMFHLRHIGINYPTGATPAEHDSALAVANDIYQKLKAGADFSEMARTRSSDPRTAGRGGDMGWVDTGLFPPTIRAAIGSAKIGDLLGPLESPRGYEILQLLETTRKDWVVIGVPLVVKPSHQTLDLESQMANIFREQAEKNGFDQAATASGYHVVTDAPPASRKNAPIFNSHLFVDWIFSASKGDISQPMKLLRTNAIVVAQLTDIIPAGPKPLAEAKEQIAQDLAQKAAVASIAPRAQQIDALVTSNTDLTTLATTTGDPTLTPVTALMGPAESVNGLPTGEYVINNWAFSAQPGSISPLLKGERGYYIVKLMGRTIPSQKSFAAAKPNIVKEIMHEKEQRVLTDWLTNQKLHATIEDYRFKK
jgi:peptidyl-prolyl cis-trans isomerase D